MTTDIATSLAADIRREHELAQQSFRATVEHGVRCGLLLEQAKADTAHGEWLPWLDAEFPGSRRTAQGYMRLARHAEDAQALAHLGIEGALRQLAAPAPRRQLADIEDELGKHLELGRADLRRAVALGAHRALGHSSWRECVESVPLPDTWDEEITAIIRADMANTVPQALSEGLDAAGDDIDEVRALYKAADAWTVAATKAALRAKREYGKALGELGDFELATEHEQA